jgi:hypothetical protein
MQTRPMKWALALLAAAAMSPAAAAYAAGSPIVATGSATSVGKTTATLHGTVNPNGQATTYAFQYGTTTAYGAGTTSHSAGSGTKNVAVSRSISGLLPATVYHYRVIATSGAGASVGSDHKFTTQGPPLAPVFTGGTPVIHRTSATLTGVVNPLGHTTTYRFQYGLTPAYGVETFPGSLPKVFTGQSVSATLAGLQPGTLYHYRLIATNASGTTFGADRSFSTEPSNRLVPGVRAHTSPGRARHAPRTFTTSGTIVLPSLIAPNDGCAGIIAVRIKRGRHTVALREVAVSSLCTFQASVTFHSHHPPSKRLRVFVRFRGNSVLLPASAHSQAVRLG